MSLVLILYSILYRAVRFLLYSASIALLAPIFSVDWLKRAFGVWIDGDVNVALRHCHQSQDLPQGRGAKH